MTVAEMIKKTRTEANMTQGEYGAKFGVSRQTVSSWENGRSLPDLQMLIDICNTYHVSLDKLLNEDKEFVEKIDFYNKYKKAIRLLQEKAYELTPKGLTLDILASKRNLEDLIKWVWLKNEDMTKQPDLLLGWRREIGLKLVEYLKSVE